MHFVETMVEERAGRERVWRDDRCDEMAAESVRVKEAATTMPSVQPLRFSLIPSHQQAGGLWFHLTPSILNAWRNVPRRYLQATAALPKLS